MIIFSKKFMMYKLENYIFSNFYQILVENHLIVHIRRICFTAGKKVVYINMIIIKEKDLFIW